MPKSNIHLVECPRDAMQGWKHLIPTAKKIEYLNALLKVGFDTIDFGSFVSPKAIPQMADTREIIQKLSMDNSRSKLLAIVANRRGAEEAVAFDEIACLGFPFSISEGFQQRNTNSSMEASLARVEEIQSLCSHSGKNLVIYISMGFGNPYGDPYNEEIVYHWVNRFVTMGIGTISVADTVGVATPRQVSDIIKYLVDAFPATEIGVHLHSNPTQWQPKVEAAFEAGCLRFDGALKGVGGCPMATDELVGNLNTECLVPHFKKIGVLPDINEEALQHCIRMAEEIFMA